MAGLSDSDPLRKASEKLTGLAQAKDPLPGSDTQTDGLFNLSDGPPSSQGTFNLPESQGGTERGILEEGVDAFLYSLGPQNIQLMGAGIRAFGATSQNEGVYKAGYDLEIYGENLDFGKPPSMPDIEGAESLARWIAGGLGQGLGSVGVPLAGGAVGGLAGAAAGGPAGAAIGAIATGFTANDIILTGEAFRQFEASGVEGVKAAEVAVAIGPLMAALDTLGLVKALRGPKRKASDALLKHIGKSMAHGAGVEAATEMAQGVIREVTDASLSGDVKATERALSIMEEGIIAGMTGGVLGGAGGSLARRPQGGTEPAPEPTPETEPLPEEEPFEEALSEEEEAPTSLTEEEIDQSIEQAETFEETAPEPTVEEIPEPEPAPEPAPAKERPVKFTREDKTYLVADKNGNPVQDVFIDRVPDAKRWDVYDLTKDTTKPQEFFRLKDAKEYVENLIGTPEFQDRVAQTEPAPEKHTPDTPENTPLDEDAVSFDAMGTEEQIEAGEATDFAVNHADAQVGTYAPPKVTGIVPDGDQAGSKEPKVFFESELGYDTVLGMNSQVFTSDKKKPVAIQKDIQKQIRDYVNEKFTPVPVSSVVASRNDMENVARTATEQSEAIDIAGLDKAIEQGYLPEPGQDQESLLAPVHQLGKTMDDLPYRDAVRTGIISVDDHLANRRKLARISEARNLGVGPDVEVIRSKRSDLWHGSGALFDRFDFSYMGTGEGNQAFGWGGYLAERRRTAEVYRSMASGSQYEVSVSMNGQTTEFNSTANANKFLEAFGLLGSNTMYRNSRVIAPGIHRAFREKALFPSAPINFKDQMNEVIAQKESTIRTKDKGVEVFAARARMSESEGDMEKARFFTNQTNKYIADQHIARRDLEDLKKDIEVTEEALSRADIKVRKPGGLYQVGLDITEDEILLWDFPVYEMPPAMQKKVVKAVYDSGASGDSASDILDETGAEIYSSLQTVMSAEEVSRHLSNHGIKAQKYLDGGSRSKGTGTYNYVVFDEQVMEVINRFKRPPPRPSPRNPSPKMSRDAVQAVVDRMTKKWDMNRIPPIEVIRDARDLPAKIRDALGLQTGDVPGDLGVALYTQFKDGSSKVYVFSDQVRNSEDITRAVSHEVVGHFSMREMLGDDLQSTLDDVKKLRNSAKMKPYWDMADELYADFSEDVRAEEVIAMMSETREENPIMTKVIAAIRRFLRGLGFRISYTYADIRAMLVRAERRLDKEASEKMQDISTDPDPVYQRVPEALRFAFEAWKGASTRYGEFDVEKIGSGEWASRGRDTDPNNVEDSYGWGHYLTSKEEVADWYKRHLTRIRERMAGISSAPSFRTQDGQEFHLQSSDLNDNHYDNLILALDPFDEIGTVRLMDIVDRWRIRMEVGQSHHLLSKTVARTYLTDAFNTNLDHRLEKAGAMEAKAELLRNYDLLDFEYLHIPKNDPSRYKDSMKARVNVDIDENTQLLDWDLQIEDQHPEIARKLSSVIETGGLLHKGNPISQKVGEYELNMLSYVAAADISIEAKPGHRADVFDVVRALFHEAYSPDKAHHPQTKNDLLMQLLLELETLAEYGLNQFAIEDTRRILKRGMALGGFQENTIDDLTGAQVYRRIWGETGSQREASEKLAAAGILGNSYRSNSGNDNYVIFGDEHLEITGRWQRRKRKDPLAKPPGPREAKIIDPKRPIESIFRILMAAPLGGIDQYGNMKMTKGMQKKARAIIREMEPREDGRFGWSLNWIRSARYGWLNRYGTPDDFVVADRSRAAHSYRIMNEMFEFLEQISDANMTNDQYEQLQEILEGGELTDESMKGLASEIRESIDQYGLQLVEYGLLPEETYLKNLGTYLHRSYARYESQGNKMVQIGRKVRKKSRHSLRGDELKRRGMNHRLDTKRMLHDINKADRKALENHKDWKIIEVRREENPTRVQRRYYVPIGKEDTMRIQPPEPDGHLVVDRGDWSVRYTKGAKPVLWRDYTKEEREEMGEIRDARYNLIKTYELLAHDISTGKFFHDIAQNPEWFVRQLPDGQSFLDASQVSGSLINISMEEWVKVPEGKIAKTNVNRWGALAGGYIKAPLWRDLNELEKMQNPGYWGSILRFWKASKTAWSPTVHFNNFMGNWILAELYDLTTGDFRRALTEYRRKGPLYQSAIEHGVFDSGYVRAELLAGGDNSKMVDEILKEVHVKEGTQDGPLWKTMAIISRGARGMEQAYQFEDEIFRLVSYMSDLSYGISSEKAAENAINRFMNYDIRAPIPNALRKTIFPFLSYTYAFVPAWFRAVSNKPWKIAKVASIGYAVSMLADLVHEGEEEDERRVMSERDSGYTWAGLPKTLRTPFSSDGDPVYIGLQRLLPGGGLTDMDAGHVSGMPEWLLISGPLLMAGELFLNRLSFNGEDIVGTVDTGMEKAAKRGAYLWRGAMPNAPWIPGSYNWDMLSKAISGQTDMFGRNYSPAIAGVRQFGPKLYPFDYDTQLAYRMMAIDKEAREYKKKMWQLSMDKNNGKISDRAFRRGIERVETGLRRLAEKANELTGGN